MPFAQVNQTVVPVGAESTPYNIRLNRRREVVSASEVRSWVLEGKVFTFNAGTVSAPITIGNAAITAQRPELWVRNIAGSLKIVVPLKIRFVLEAGAAGLVEMVAATTTNDVGNGTSTAVTPQNMFTSSAQTSGMTCARQATGNVTAETGLNEFWRDGYPTRVDVAGSPYSHFEWDALNSSAVPLVGSPGSLLFYAGGAVSTTGFITITYAELFASELS